MKKSKEKSEYKDKEEEMLNEFLINRENQNSALKKILEKINPQKQ
jgi:hypothetical protein